MAKGVKKIKCIKGLYYPEMTTNNRIAIVPDQYVSFGVSEWLPDTTDADKKRQLIWLQQANDRKTILNQVPSSTGYKFKISKRLSGNYYYYIEASLSGKRDFKNSTGLYVKGHCDSKIISSKWTTQPGSKNSIKNKNKTNYISYGHIVYLNLTTEGLNGNHVIVEIYNQQYAKDDKLIYTYHKVQVIDGEVNIKIENTYSWMAFVDNIQKVEEFYIKVKDPRTKKYIKDNLGDDLHAIYLNVKNKVVSTVANVSQNLTPTKVYKPDVNAVRNEPCKFGTIKITESEVKDGKASNTSVTVFNNGIGLRKINGGKETINRTIFFKFDSTVIDKDGEAILNNILKFLLEHQGSTMNLSGYACVIGKQNYNKGLSQRRADIVKKFFADGGLASGRIISVGKGEVDPTDDKMGRDNIRYRNEKDYENNRRVDISFVFNMHDAQTINYEVIAPSVSTKKDLTIEVANFDTKICYRDSKNRHKKEIYVIDVGQAIDKGDSKQVFSTPSFNYKVYSDLSRFNAFPIQYIWPAATNPNQFHLHVHSCRYYSNEKRTTVLIKAYPDIKWELAVEFLVNVSNYKAANMPVGNIFAKHQEKAREAGYKRWRMNETGKVPISIGVGLSAEWNNGSSKRSLTNEFADKIEIIARTIASAINIVQNAINFAQSTAKTASLPAAFDIRYPKFTVVGNWYLERIGTKNELSVIGEVGFGFRPLIGANLIIDIIGAAIALGSYATTGNPAAAKLIERFRGGLEKLGASVVFTATFYGEIEIMVEALKIDSINGIDMQGKSTLGGKMGVLIELSVSVEIGKVKGTKTKPIITFKAAARADSYFGGDIIFDSDERGLFIQPVLKFSGVLLSVEIEGELGWWKSNFKIEERVIEDETYYMERKYFN